MIPQFPCSVCHKCIGDKEKYSSSYALMHLTETIKQYLDLAVVFLLISKKLLTQQIMVFCLVN